MDWIKAILCARLVMAAEAMSLTQIDAAANNIIPPELARGYSVLATIYGNDLATEHNHRRRDLIVSFGFIAQSEAGDVVVALRGTSGIHEWLLDCLFCAVPCPFLEGAGHTEDGFTEIYQSLRVGRQPEAQSLREAFTAMVFPRPVRTVTITGHSLGAALATLFAVDLAGNTPYRDLEVYTFASPRAGDVRFAEVFHQLVPRAFRIANRMDIVTEVPPAWLAHATPYRHVEATTILVPGVEVGKHIVCMHCLTTYLYLMRKQAGLPEDEHPLAHACCGGREQLLASIL